MYNFQLKRATLLSKTQKRTEMCFLDHTLLLLGEVRILKTCLLDRSYIAKGNKDTSSRGCVCCEGKRWQVCKHVCVTGTFHYSATGKKYTINFRFNCNSSNVVYLLECRVCCKQYGSSTVTPFRIRLIIISWGIVDLIQVLRLHKLVLSAISLRKDMVDSWRISRLRSSISLQVVMG